MILIPSDDPLLRKPTRSVELEEIPAIKPKLREMLDMMKQSGGIGLAAPQVGLDINAFVMGFAGHDRCCVNPMVMETSEETDSQEEGCLSFPGLRLQVKRPLWAQVGWFDEDGEPRRAKLVGYEARVFLHEWDHCQGIVFTDRVSRTRLDMARRKAEKEIRRAR